MDDGCNDEARQSNLLTILLRVFSAAAAAGVDAMGSIEVSLEEEEDVFPFTWLLPTPPPPALLAFVRVLLSRKGLLLLVNGLERPIVAYFPFPPVVVDPFVAANGFLPEMPSPPPLTSLEDESPSPFCRNGLVLLLVKRVSF